MEIGYIKTLLNLPVETCGYVNKDLIPVVDGVPEDSTTGRGKCRNNKYYPVIWHTHPVNMQSYPSVEDIIKILKPRPNGIPKISLIFTRWGIWNLWSGRKGVVSKELTRLLSKTYSGLYHITNKGRGDISIPFVNSYINELEYILSDYNFNIRLTLWSEIRGDIYNLN